MNYQKALKFATEKHASQVRKYTGEPYINHCLEVVSILDRHGIHTMVAKMAAILHDTVEDTGATFQEIEENFGPLVRNMVFFLTNIVGPEQGNRATRVDLNIAHIVGTPYPLTLYIKLADLISNTASIVERDPQFAKVYLVEKKKLLDAMANCPAGEGGEGMPGIEEWPIYQEALALCHTDDIIKA